MTIFSVSNGYLSTLAMMYGAATGNTLSDDERGLAGLVTSFALQVGISAGLAIANAFATLKVIYIKKYFMTCFFTFLTFVYCIV